MEILNERLQFLSLVFLDGITYFLIAMIGAFIKDIYDTISGVRSKIKIYRITIASILSTMLTFAARSHLDQDTTIAFTFLIGVIGWELFSRICTIRGLKETALDFKKFFRLLTSSDSKDDENKKE